MPTFVTDGDNSRGHVTPHQVAVGGEFQLATDSRFAPPGARHRARRLKDLLRYAHTPASPTSTPDPPRLRRAGGPTRRLAGPPASSCVAVSAAVKRTRSPCRIPLGQGLLGYSPGASESEIDYSSSMIRFRTD